MRLPLLGRGAKKSVRSLPALRHAFRYPSDSSSSDSSSRHFSSSYAISDSLDDSSTASSMRPSRKRWTDLEADIIKCIAYADAIRARGMDDRDVVETAAEEEVESKERDTVEVEVDPRVRPVVDYDVREFVREDVSNYIKANRVVEVTYETLGDLVQRFHDHVVEIPVYWIQVIESEQRL
ncbi:hypothetical protein Tco_1339588 [Tanacetum coccineum]